MKRFYALMLVIALLVLAGCSGEAYIEVKNDTDAQISISVNDQANEVLASGDTSDTYTIKVLNGLVNYVSVDATGSWLSTYSENVAIESGDNITHVVRSNIAELNLVNGSVDSAFLTIDSEAMAFAGSDSSLVTLAAAGNHAVSYDGRYIFEEVSTETWMPGSSYRFEMLPNACEIEIDNLHSNYVIYYVYLSPSTEQTWGDDRLGDVTLSPNEGYIWKVEDDIQWDLRIEAGDPHPDSSLHPFEFNDFTARQADATYIYEFPTIFSEVQAAPLAKSQAGQARLKSNGALSKTKAALDVKIQKVAKKQVALSSSAIIVTK